MADVFVAEIRILPFTFAPKGWAFCAGQLMAISQNTALFSLLGTQYGGDGKSNFALPNLQGYVAMHQGNGAGLTSRVVGETSGEESVTLLVQEIPSHTHGTNCDISGGNDYGPTNDFWAPDAANGSNEYGTGSPVNMNQSALAPTGGSQPHNNLQPYQAMNYCIALQGIFPPRS